MIVFKGDYCEQSKQAYIKALTKFYCIILTFGLPIAIAFGVFIGVFLDMWFALGLIVGLYTVPYIAVLIYMHNKGTKEADRTMPSKIVFDFTNKMVYIYDKVEPQCYTSFSFNKIKKIESAPEYFRCRALICQKNHISEEERIQFETYFAEKIICTP